MATRPAPSRIVTVMKELSLAGEPAKLVEKMLCLAGFEKARCRRWRCSRARSRAFIEIAAMDKVQGVCGHGSVVQ
jgi:hypothetical protein